MTVPAYTKSLEFYVTAMSSQIYVRFQDYFLIISYSTESRRLKRYTYVGVFRHFNANDNQKAA